MSWNIAQAKQQFSEVVRQAAGEPQMIYNRDRCVAAVIDAETFRQFSTWQQSRKKTLGQWFAELRELANGDPDPIPLLPRTSRPNAFVAMLDEGAFGEEDDR